MIPVDDIPSGSHCIAAVVLNHGTPDETLLAVHSLLASKRPIHHIVVVNNDPGDTTRRALEPVKSRILFRSTGGNLGFSGGINVGIRQALKLGAESILIANSDVIVPPDCVGLLEQSLLARRSEAGIAGPLVLRRSEPDRIETAELLYSPANGRLRLRHAGQRLSAVRAEPDRIVDGVSGCLMLVRRVVLDAIGLFDERYFFGFEDLDLCLRARRAGFSTVLVAGAAVYHEGSRTIGAASVERLYFAARNHLLLDSEHGRGWRGTMIARQIWIVLLNLAHAVRSAGVSRPAVGAVVLGIRDYLTNRFGAGPLADRS